jgi:hypothetical protein
MEPLEGPPSVLAILTLTYMTRGHNKVKKTKTNKNINIFGFSKKPRKVITQSL